MTRRTIAMNTGGGDCPGLNAVMRAVVKRGIIHFSWRILGIEDAFDGLMAEPPRYREMTRDSIAGALIRGGTLLGTSNHSDPFAAKLKGEPGASQDLSALVAKRLQDLGCEGLIALGGDGTMRICHRLAETTGMKIVGVPKTIDNDLLGTDLTFGFNSAVEFATLAVDRLHTTAESHDRVMVVEVMGRDSGFIALHAGVGGGADAILIPEIPYDLNKVARKLLDRQAMGRFFSIVVVAEGAREIDGSQKHNEFTGGTGARLGGIARDVAQKLHDLTGIETRYTVLGHLQRGGIPSAFDRILATRLGSHAVELVERGEWNRMVCLKNDKVDSISLAEAAHGTRKVDLGHDLMTAARGVGICFGD